MVYLQSNLAYLRAQHALPQEKVATAAGVTIKRYQHWEYGRAKPSYEHLKKLCDLYDTDIDELLFCDLTSNTRKVTLTSAQKLYQAFTASEPKVKAAIKHLLKI